MKEDSIIKEMYDYFDEMSFGFRPSNMHFRRCESNRNKAYEKLLDALPADIKKLYEEYEDADSTVELMMYKEAYRQGVCFGVKLTSEAFVTNMNKTVNTSAD